MELSAFCRPAWPAFTDPRSITHLPHLAIPSDPGAALAFAVYHDRRADILLSQGRAAQAEAAAHLAFEARIRASEVLA